MARRKAPSGVKPAAPSRPAGSAAPAAAEAPKPRTSPSEFVRQVRAETRKITWTSWKETWITSVMVGIMVVVVAVFFLAIDGALNFLVQQLLKFASG